MKSRLRHPLADPNLHIRNSQHRLIRMGSELESAQWISMVWPHRVPESDRSTAAIRLYDFLNATLGPRPIYPSARAIESKIVVDEHRVKRWRLRGSSGMEAEKNGNNRDLCLHARSSRRLPWCNARLFCTCFVANVHHWNAYPTEGIGWRDARTPARHNSSPTLRLRADPSALVTCVTWPASSSWRDAAVAVAVERVGQAQKKRICILD